jgi:hypothetical protein
MKHCENANQTQLRARKRTKGRNAQNFIGKSLRAPPAPSPPVVAAPPLTGEPISFLDFLTSRTCAEFCALVFGGRETSAGQMLHEFRKAAKFPAYYHGRPGKLTENAQTRKLLKHFARRAYRGDPDHRGVNFWERVAWLLWNSYAALMALRHRAENIKQQEIKRIESIPAKRKQRAAFMRRYRAKRDAKRRAKNTRYSRRKPKLRGPAGMVEPTTLPEPTVSYRIGAD